MSPKKQSEVRMALIANSIGFCGLLETKMKSNNFPIIQQSVFQNWCISSNFATSSGGRI